MAFDFTAALNVQTNPANLNKVNKDIQKSLNKVSLNLDAKNIAQAQGEIKKLQGSLTKAKSVAVEFGEAVSLKAVNFAAYTLASTAVLKLTGAVSNATRESIKLQTELAKIAQVTNKSNKEIFAQSNLLKKISVEYNIASSKVAQLTRTLAQTGLSFQQAAKAAEILARTSLLATFDSLQSTTEGFIATLSSFSLTVDQAGQSLEAINAVSKRFAVESSDIVEAVRRTGGAFSAAGGNINELIALFTAVRSTSRESAETIATGFRTIFGRLQRPKTIEFFKELGIQLETAEGQFVGPLQAIQNISQGLDRLNISAGSTQFAEVVEQIGGIRQLSRVVPLLTQTEKITSALGVANNGTAESAEDVAKAQQTLAFQIGQLQNNFSAFIDDVVSSPAFQTLAKAIIGIANALIEVGRALTPLIPLFTVLATLKLSSGLTSLIGGKGGGGGGGLKGLLGFNAGGFVPGSGNRDTVPAMLTPGEFVIRKSAAQAFGAENLQAINKYENGGKAKGKSPANFIQQTGRRGINLQTIDYTQVDGLLKGNEIDTQAAGALKGLLFERYIGSRTGLKTSLGNVDFPTAKQRDAAKLNPIFKDSAYKNLSGIEATYNRANADRKKGLPPNTAVIYTEFNKGGSVGSGTDTVPALLTPGEFVVNKKSAQAFGYGNLKKVNRYAKGGIVQKFQDGGFVGALGGLGGGGLLSGIGDEVLGIGTSFVTLQASTAAYSGILTQAVGPVKGLIESMKEERENRKKNAESLERLDNLRIASIQTTEELTDAYEKAVGDLEARKTKAQAINREDAFEAAEVSGSDKLFDTGTESDEEIAKANKKLAASVTQATNQYGKGSKELADIQQLQKKYAGSVVAQQAAVSKYTRELSKAEDVTDLVTKEEQKEIKALKAKVKAEKELTKKYIKEADDIKSQPQKKGFLGKLTSKEGLEKFAKGLDLAANVGIAIFVNQLNKASDAAQKLADKAIEAGDIQEAAAKAGEAVAKKQQAQAQTQASAALSGVGSAIGSIFGPAGTVIGGVLGKLASLIPGVAEGFQKLTDLLGITNSAEEERLARQQAGNAALQKFTENTLKAAKAEIALLNQLSNATNKFTQQQAILADSLETTVNAASTKSAEDLAKNPVTLESAGLGEFIEQFKKAARQSGAGSTQDVFSANKNLARSYAELIKLTELQNNLLKRRQLEKTLKNISKIVAASSARLQEFNNKLVGLQLATGKAVSAIDFFGDRISDGLKEELKQQEALFNIRFKLEQQVIKKLNSIIDSEEKLAKEQAALIGNVTITQGADGKLTRTPIDQREAIIGRTARRLQNAAGVDQARGEAIAGDSSRFNEVLDAYSASIQETIKFQELFNKENQKGSKSNQKQLKAYSLELVQLQQDTKRLSEASNILLDGYIKQEEVLRDNVQAQLKATAALDDFKGNLTKKFAFGTDEQRRELEIDAALATKALKDGFGSLSSEDRPRAAQFLEQLPPDVLLKNLGIEGAGKKTVGRFLAEQAVAQTPGLQNLTGDEREAAIKRVEDAGKPLEQRTGEAFLEGQKKIQDSFTRQQGLIDQKISREITAQLLFKDSVDKFALAVAEQKLADAKNLKAITPAEQKELNALERSVAGRKQTPEQVAADVQKFNELIINAEADFQRKFDPEVGLTPSLNEELNRLRKLKEDRDTAQFGLDKLDDEDDRLKELQALLPQEEKKKSG